MSQTADIPSSLSSSIRPGEILGGKYRLERELGRGAMGTVWAAMHLTLGQRVAIKLIAAEHAQSPEARVRFRVEAKAAARLKSRHVVQVYDDGETPDGMPYIVMEYLEGETLEARIEREHDIPLVDAVRITGQVARALARAHAQGIVHRDLKPGNIFLARSDEDELGWLAKVLDFGIAKLDEPRDHSTTKTGTVLGTPLFMSPEQVRGASNVDQRADLYSLGICFYNMLTGKYAFDGVSFGDILVSICTGPLPNLKEQLPWLPDGVVEWFERCCAREPIHRFQSADELVDGLQTAVGSSIQILNRRSVPEDQRGPSGTIKGHSPPLSPDRTPISQQDSGAFTVGADVPSGGAPTERGGRADLGSSDGGTAVLTVHDPPSSERRSGRGWLIPVLAVGFVAAATGAVLLLGRDADPERASGSGIPVSSTRSVATAQGEKPAPTAATAPSATAPEPAGTAPEEPDLTASLTPAKAEPADAVAKPAAKAPPKPAVRRPQPAKPKTAPVTDLGF